MNKRLIITILALLVFTISAIAQPKPTPAERKQHKRVEAEKIAFITKELELSSDEAKVFWPVYEQAVREDRQGFKTIRVKFDALKTAVEEGKSESEVKALLDDFIEAKASHRNGLEAYTDEFIKVLGIEKTAKLFIAEDDFRARQIHQLTGMGPKDGPDKDKERRSKK